MTKHPPSENPIRATSSTPKWSSTAPTGLWVVGALLFTAVVVLNVVYRRRGREMRDMQTEHLKSEA